MKDSKLFKGIMIALAVITIIITTGPVNKYMRRVLTSVNDVNNDVDIKATFKYLDKDDQPIKPGEKIYVFISQEDGGGGNRVTLTLEANEGEKKFTKIYSQNGDSNINGDLEGEYFVKVAIPTNGHEKDEVKDSAKFEPNNYKVYNPNDIYNGSYVVSYNSKINISGNKEVSLEITFKEKEGTRYKYSDVVEPLDLETNFGIFTRHLWLEADSEATIAVQNAEKITSNFGLSDKNYEGLQKVIESRKVTINKTYTKNGSPLSGQDVTIQLISKTNNDNKIESKCKTNSDGKCSVTFDKLEDGIYDVFEIIDGKTLKNGGTITDKDGNKITSSFSKEYVDFSSYSDLDKLYYNYNYVGSANTTNQNQVELNKMRGPGTLAVGTDELYNTYSGHQEFKKEGQEVTVVKPGTTEYPTIDFNSEFDKLNNLSTNLAKAIDSEILKVYYLSSSDIEKSDIDFKSEGKEYILVNVDCTGLNKDLKIGGKNKRDGKTLVSDEDSFIYNDAEKVIYNFYTMYGDTAKPYEKNIEIDGATTGIFLAPSATVNGANGNHSGTIIALNYHHTKGEVHQKVKPKNMSTSLDITNIMTTEETNEVKVRKVDVSKNPVKGATMELLNSNGVVIETWVTNGSDHVFAATLNIGEKYTIRETKAPEGYQLVDDYTFEYKGSEVIELIDTKVLVKKISEDGQYLEGATLQILDQNEKVIEQWVTTKQPYSVKEKLVVGQKYILRELQAPEEYEKSEDIEFVLSSNEDKEITMTDTKVKVQVEPKIVTLKLDQNQNLLSGAELQILDKNGKVIEEWVTDGSEHIIEAQLNIGETYILHEKSAPKGYKVADDIEFKVENTTEVQEIKMIDERIKKVAGIVETFDSIKKYFELFIISLILLVGSFLIYTNPIKKKLSK